MNIAHVASHWVAKVRENGSIVEKTGEVVDRKGDRLALDFGDGKRPRWFPMAKIRPLTDRFVDMGEDLQRQAKLDKKFCPPDRPGLIEHDFGRDFLVQECCYLDEKKPVKVEKVEFIDGDWECLVRGPGIATAAVEGAKPTRETERLWVCWQRLTPAPVGRKIRCLFKGEVNRRGEDYGMASHRQRHYKFTARHMYHKKVRISPPRPKDGDPRALEKGWQKKLPPPYVIFGKSTPAHGWNPKHMADIRHPIPARGGAVVFPCHEHTAPEFLETIGVGGIPAEHEAEKLRAERFEARCKAHNKGETPPPLDAKYRYWMATTKELCVVNDRNKIVLARVVSE